MVKTVSYYPAEVRRIGLDCTRIRLQIANLLRPHGGDHFDGMVTAADNVLLLFHRLIDVDASQNGTPIDINGAAEKLEPIGLTLAPFRP